MKALYLNSIADNVGLIEPDTKSYFSECLI